MTILNKLKKKYNKQFRNVSSVLELKPYRVSTKLVLNPYLRDFGNVMERHLWTKNPQTHFWFWWRHTSINFFYCMFILNHMSSPNYTPLGLITWRHHSEISRDEYKCTRNPGNMVERHLWTKNPHNFFFEKVKKHHMISSHDLSG